MRTLSSVLIGGALVSAGCSAFIASRGTDLTELTNREESHKQLGSPVESGTEEGKDYDIFRYHGKIARWNPGPGPAMLLIMTWGLSEFVNVPYELGVATADFVVGSEVKFWYDGQGQVVTRTVDGEGFWFNFPRTWGPKGKPSQPPDPPPAEPE